MKPALIVLTSLTLLGCVYNAPPSVERVEPVGGVLRTGDPIELRFSEAVDPATVRVRIWASNWDIEGNLDRDQGPLLDTCRLDEAPCGSTELEALEFTDEGEPSLLVGQDSLTGLRIRLDPEGLGRPNYPVVL